MLRQLIQLSKSRNFFEPEFLQFDKKKTDPGQIGTQHLCLPRRIRYLRAKCAGVRKKIELVLNEGITKITESCEQRYSPEKKSCTQLQYPCLSQGYKSKEKHARKYKKIYIQL